jgi:LacI family transcriptional regulator
MTTAKIYRPDGQSCAGPFAAWARSDRWTGLFALCRLIRTRPRIGLTKGAGHGGTTGWTERASTPHVLDSPGGPYRKSGGLLPAGNLCHSGNPPRRGGARRNISYGAMSNSSSVRPRTPRRGSGGVTISDVARTAGVSAMTVSRVINRHAAVADATRLQVQAVIDSLNYVPNQAAHILAAGRGVTLGMVYDNPSSAYFGELLIGVLEECSRHTIRLDLQRGGTPDRDLAAVRALIDSGVDGLLLPPPLSDSAAILNMAASRGIPVVAMATSARPEVGFCIGIDDLAAADLMTRRLIDLGHRRIGFICGKPDQTASRLRLKGYRAALRACGLDADPALVARGSFTFSSGMQAAEKLLDLAEPPTAIFASNDDMAVGVITVAHQRRLSLPGQLSVAGFDDTPLATTVHPALTTIRQPITSMAQWSVQRMAALIKHQEPAGDPPSGVTGFSLIERQSVAAPAELKA